MAHSTHSFRPRTFGAGSSRVLLFSLLVSAAAALAACSDDTNDPGGQSSSTGGAGGAVSSTSTSSAGGGTGGSSSTGGSGGVGGAGGTTGSGGVGGAGGTTGSGGDGGAGGTMGSGGDGGAGGAGGGGGTTADPIFSTDALTFTAEVGAGPGVCYDFDVAAAVDCGESAWDLMFEVDTLKHAFYIWTNGGVKGTGKGAAFGPMTQADAEAKISSKDIPGWFADYYGGIFVDFPWYGYDVMGTHDVSANGRVYVVDTGTDKYRVQLPSYYGAGGISGMVTLRYGKLSEATWKDVELDATAGGFGALPDDPKNRAAYFDLDAGEIVDINDAEARSTNTTWDIGIKRFSVVLNGGASGPGTVKGAIADKQEDLYDANGDPIPAKFTAIKGQPMIDAFEAIVDATGLTFKADEAKPYLINDGKAQSWFKPNPPPPMPPTFDARPENWWAIRSAGGDSYAKVHVTNIVSATYAFTVELFVQPKAE